MGKGKIAAQCGHAILGAYKRTLKISPGNVEKWEASGQAKVVLKTEKDNLFVINSKAKEKGIASFIVRDAGKTQISPGEYTAVAIGPGPAEVIDSITGNLKLL